MGEFVAGVSGPAVQAAGRIEAPKCSWIAARPDRPAATPAFVARWQQERASSIRSRSKVEIPEVDRPQPVPASDRLGEQSFDAGWILGVTAAFAEFEQGRAVPRRGRALVHRRRGGLVTALIEELAVSGASSTGKSHFVGALAQKAIEADLSVAWFTPETRTATISRAKTDGSTARTITRICRSDLIVVDDIIRLPSPCCPGVVPARPLPGKARRPTPTRAHRRRIQICTDSTGGLAWPRSSGRSALRVSAGPGAGPDLGPGADAHPYRAKSSEEYCPVGQLCRG